MNRYLNLVIISLVLVAAGVVAVAESGGPVASVQTPLDTAISVKQFGATGDGSTDDTAAIQAAIDSVRTRGGTIYIPSGTYSISSLNLTDIEQGLTLVGDGINATRLMPNRNGVHVLDLSGSLNIRLQNFQVGAYDQKITPLTAILLGQVPSDRSNAFRFDDLYISGRYSVAVFYCFGVPSSTAVHCIFYNYMDRPVPVVAFTRNNYAGVTSTYTKLRTTPSAASDWTWVGCEIHDIGRNSGKSRATALRLDGTSQMRWFGGNIAGCGQQLVLFSDDPKYTIFQGTTFYSDTGEPATEIFHNSDKVEGLSVSECLMQSAAETILGGAPEAVYDEVQFASKPTANGFNGYLINCPKGLLTNSLLHCDGLKMDIGTITDTLLIHPGKINAQKSEAMIVGSTGAK